MAGIGPQLIPLWCWDFSPKWPVFTQDCLREGWACYLMAPSHYLNQCWLIICEALWHSLERNFIWKAQDIHLLKDTCKITSIFPRDQWVNPSYAAQTRILSANWVSTITTYILDPCGWEAIVNRDFQENTNTKSLMFCVAASRLKQEGSCLVWICLSNICIM